MNVRCINAGNFKNLTIDKEYVVLEETPDRYIIDNDNDVRATYAKKYFTEVVETREVGMGGRKPKKVAKEKVLRVMSMADYVTRCINDGELPIEMECCSSPNSCGVGLLDGLNEIFGECDDILNNPNHILDITEEALPINFNRESFIREVLRRMFDGCSSDGGSTFYMFTTNDAFPECTTIFKTMCLEAGGWVTNDITSRSSNNDIFVAILSWVQIGTLAIADYPH